jgi:hypothetical protein
MLFSDSKNEGSMTTASIPTINPTGIYDDALLRDVLGVSGQTLARARRDGQLRFTQKGKRTLHLGSWVLAWLEADGRQEAHDGTR